MRTAFKAGYLAIISLLGAIGLTIGAAFSAAFAFGAVALIVPGTGTPNANIVANYLEQARDRYLKDTACGPTGAACPDGNLSGINYPASFFPLAFIPNWCRSGPDGCDKWDVSVGKGTEELQKQLNTALTTTNEDVVVFGYSQGGAVVSNVLNGYINGLDVDTKKRIKIVTIGGIETPDGGLWSRLSPIGFLPFFDITFGPAMKPDTGVNYISYAFHFDPVADAPRYFGNPFALLNAVAALETVHGYYLTPNGNGPNETLPYGYTDATLAPALVCTNNPNCRTDRYGNQYVVVPATSLPIADFIYRSAPAALRPIIKPLLELVAPAYRVLAELGYDYSGDPSVATPASLLPFNPFTFNPVSFALQFAGAIGQGITNALGGGTSLSPLNPPETSATTTAVQAFSRLATQSAVDQSAATPAAKAPGTTENVSAASALAASNLTAPAVQVAAPSTIAPQPSLDVVPQSTPPGTVTEKALEPSPVIGGSNVVPLQKDQKGTGSNGIGVSQINDKTGVQIDEAPKKVELTGTGLPGNGLGKPGELKQGEPNKFEPTVVGAEKVEPKHNGTVGTETAEVGGVTTPGAVNSGETKTGEAKTGETKTGEAKAAA